VFPARFSNNAYWGCVYYNAVHYVVSDLQGVRTNAKKDGDDWILNGSKVFITNGFMSGVVIVVTVTNPQAKSAAHGISLFLVEEGMAGFKKGRKLDKIGLKAQVGVDERHIHHLYSNKVLKIKSRNTLFPQHFVNRCYFKKDKQTNKLKC
jgi:hypothetical protein